MTTKRIDLVVGERIPQRDGNLSPLIYLGESPTTKVTRKILARCVCGTLLDVTLGGVRAGVGRCSACSALAARVDLIEGELISLVTGGLSGFTLIHELPLSSGPRRVRVACSCGRIVDMKLASIRSNHATCCLACRRERSWRDLTGESFGRLLVTGVSARRTSAGSLMFDCLCSCGTVSVVAGGALVKGEVNSCGCLRHELLLTTRNIDWNPGDIVGKYKIIERLPNEGKQGTRFRVEDTATGCLRDMPQSLIRATSTSLGEMLIRQRRRIRHFVSRRNIRKTFSIAEKVSFTREELGAHLGAQYKGDQLDHICPLNCARDIAEALALCSLENLQWLSAAENRKKSDRKTPEGERLHLKLLGRGWE